MINKEKKVKKKYVDDGHTIYSMDVDAKWSKTHKDNQTVYVDKKEKRMLIKAAFMAYFPKLLLVLACFTFAVILIYFWLK